MATAKRKPKQPVAQSLPWTGVSLEQWRASETRVNFMQKILASPLGRDLVSVLVSTCPPPDISDASRAAIEAGRCRGYMQCLAVLQSMADHAYAHAREVPADYSGTLEQILSEVE